MKVKTLLLGTFLVFFSNLVISQTRSLPYSTGFDTEEERLGWRQVRTGDSNGFRWNISGYRYTSPPYSLEHDYNVGGEPTDTIIDWYISPPLDFSKKGKISLKIYYYGPSTPIEDNFEIWFGTNYQDPAIGDFYKVETLSFIKPDNEWIDTTINIPFVTSKGYVAFRYKTIGLRWCVYTIDDVLITEDTTSHSGTIENLDSSVKVFPNPFSNTTTFEINSDQFLSTSTRILIFNALGEKVHEQNVRDKRTTLERDKLTDGIYLYHVVNEGIIKSTGKLLIQ
jgi:hypothetical protein